MVELKNVSVTYQTTGIQALNNISLKVNDGEFAFVVGSSGAGKSTLIKLLLKEIDATSGVVTVNGYNLTNLKRSRLVLPAGCGEQRIPASSPAQAWRRSRN